ncbi:MAG: hypothetical protein KJ583_02600 [Nanoarchaeota archaeon]|nr:hypothetical protein [Nanoarchaeota archaeon]MBU1269943.1 hypothetical protein [Nanoarchaeota archaeon]MBU1604184.1 hypothetical protein [Nanoarchaeota archaeon]MBU2443085.1 hypothetical protein [Nanoarchaeota archaeon]
MEKIGKKVSSGNNTPYKKFRAGAIVATVWENENTNKEGQKIAYKTVSFERSYKDKNDNWQTTNSLRTNDLPKAILVLTKAFELLSLSDNGSSEED